MRSRKWILAAVAVAAFGGSWALKRTPAVSSGSRPAPAVERIVSLAPSTTEVLFALGLGDRVAGVTRYCEYPPEARAKPKMGGYYDPNFEAIVQARPDLVVTLPEHEEIRAQLHALRLRTLTVDHFSVRGILQSISLVGETCGVAAEASRVRERMEARIRAVQARVAGRPPPRVLVSIARMAGDDSMSRITVCGRGGFIDELIGLAGGVNAFDGPVNFPALSPEGVVALRPDVVIDMWSDLKQKNIDPEGVRRQWTALPGFTARVHVVGESYAVIPGPRVVLLLEEMAGALHPEAARD